ncbi:MAG: dienelactone hydrolase family protein [Pseudomonadota bacterium]
MFLKYAALTITLSLVPFSALATETPNNIEAEVIEYKDGDTVLEGYYVPSRCGDLEESYPTVMVIHQWKGLSGNEKMRAEMLSRQCYNAFAIDMYGKGIRPTTMEDAAAESNKYKNNPELALGRMNAALDYLKTRPHVDTENLAAIGYCFGGGMALELSRSGADINAAVSHHGTLSSAIDSYDGNDVKAKILAFHGSADPYVTQEDVMTFINEMKDHEITYEFVGYPGVVHSFTQIESGTDASTGAAYDLDADRDSWAQTLRFLDEELNGSEE